MGLKTVKEAIKDIEDYYLKQYFVDSNKENNKFLNSILQDVDSKSWQDGYSAAKKDNNIY
jgi:hypothetical protein